MTPDEFLKIFKQRQIHDGFEVDELTLYLMLGRPTELDYLVSGLMDKNDRTELDKQSLWKKGKVLAKPLVSHNFRFRMLGTAAGPEGCFEEKCQLDVNAGDIDEYRRREATATIGWGRFARNVFRLSLNVAPEIARNIIQRQLLAPKVEQGYGKDEEKGPNTVRM